MRGDDARRRVVSPASENIFSIPERRDALETLARAVENESAATTTTTRGFDTSRAVATPARDDDEMIRELMETKRRKGDMEPVRAKYATLRSRQNELTVLNLMERYLGPTEARVIGGLLTVNRSLTKIDVRSNELDDESKTLLRDAVKDKSGFELLV